MFIYLLLLQTDVLTKIKWLIQILIRNKPLQTSIAERFTKSQTGTEILVTYP